MRIFSLLALFLAFNLSSFSQVYLDSYELIASYSKADLKDVWKQNKVPNFIVKVEHGFDVYEVIYNTSWHDGTCVKASGWYFAPKDMKEDAALLVYNHGTQIERERTHKLKGQQAICAGYATDGFAVIWPDYLGLGKGEKFHLYQHAESEATASVDMIRAVRELNNVIGFKANDQLFLTGYSQGGHATMATHKYIQDHNLPDIKVTASAPMSGAYDMAGVQGEVMFQPYSHPGYLPYLLIGYNEVYGFFEDIFSIFKEPYRDDLKPLFNGEHSMGDVNKVMPAIPKDALQDELIAQYLNNPNYPLRKALEENSNYDWKPEAPMLLCYCNADEQVNYKNALVAYETMKANGSEYVKIRNSGKKFGHNKCALFSAVYTGWFFDSVRDGSKKGRKGPLFKRMMLNIAKSKF